MQKAKCPICNSDVIVEDGVYESDIVECAVCKSISEITTLHPISLNLVEDHSGDEEEDEE